MKFIIRITALLVLVSAFLLTGCNSKPSPDSAEESGKQPKIGGSITYRLSGPVTSLNVLLAQDEPTLIATFFLLNSRIVSFDPVRQVYKPSLANTISVLDDGRTVEIELRENILFSDGKPITSEDVIFSLEAIYDPKSRADAFRDSMLIGGKAIIAEKIDDRRIRFIFPDKIASPENYLENLFVLPSHILKPAKENGTLAEVWKIDSDPSGVVSSGPFIVESVTPGEKLILRRNPNYWRKDDEGHKLPYLDQLVLETIPDLNNAYVRLGQGTLDIIDRLRPTDYAAIKSAGGVVRAVDLGPGFSTDHIWFNLNPATADGKSRLDTPKYKWFTDNRFRRAVSYAIDRESIAANTLQGLATPLYGFVTPANRVWLDPELPKTQFDPEQAKRLLSDAGFQVKNGTDNSLELIDTAGNKVEFTLAVQSENEQRKLIAAAVQRDLAQIGIKMNIATADSATISQLWAKTFEYDAILQGLAVTGIDPSAYANFLLSGAGVHQWHPLQRQPQTDWEAKIDNLYAEQAKESIPEKRREIFFSIQRIIADEMPIIPIAARHITSASNSRIGNYEPSVLIPYSLWNADQIFVR